LRGAQLLKLKELFDGIWTVSCIICSIEII